MPSVAAILAGGRSERLGHDKRFLTAEAANHSWLDRAIRVAAEATDTGLGDVIVLGDVPNHRCLPDAASVAHQGPLGAIATLFEHVPHDGHECLILPVDLPRVQAALLKRLMGTEAPAARFEGENLPLVFRRTPEAAAHLQRVLAEPQRSSRSLREWFRRLRGREVTLSDEERWQLLNVNTPADLERWRKSR